LLHVLKTCFCTFPLAVLGSPPLLSSTKSSICGSPRNQTYAGAFLNPMSQFTGYDPVDVGSNTWGFIFVLTISLTSSFWILPRYASSRTIHAPTTSPNLASGTETAAASRIAGEAVRTFSIRTGKRFCFMRRVIMREGQLVGAAQPTSPPRMMISYNEND